jgi:Tfp pilus assembly protein PilE
VDLNVVVAIVVSLGSAALVIWRGGVQVGRIEAALTRLIGIEARLEKVDSLELSVAVLNEQNRAQKSQHNELKQEVALMRSRLPSTHG